MSVQTHNQGRTADISASIYLVRWLQVDAGTDQIYGTSSTTGDLNVLAQVAKDRSGRSGDVTTWFKNPSPGQEDDGETNAAWYGREIRVPFTRTQPYNDWHTFDADMTAFVEAAFPGELIVKANRRMERPLPGDVSAPAKYVIWTIEYD